MSNLRKDVSNILIENFGLEREKVLNNTPLWCMDVDSIVIVEIQLELERQFSVQISDGDIMPTYSLDKIVGYIKHKRDTL